MKAKYQALSHQSRLKSGLAFAGERSVKCAVMAAERYLSQLASYGIKPAELTFQTDSGVEFSGTMRKKADRGPD